jgi:hypothetical protein
MFAQPIGKLLLVITGMVVIGFIYLAWADGVFLDWKRALASIGTIVIIAVLLGISQKMDKQ